MLPLRHHGVAPKATRSDVGCKPERLEKTVTSECYVQVERASGEFAKKIVRMEKHNKLYLHIFSEIKKNRFFLREFCKTDKVFITLPRNLKHKVSVLKYRVEIFSSNKRAKKWTFLKQYILRAVQPM